jgi:hypothetical protein
MTGYGRRLPIDPTGGEVVEPYTAVGLVPTVRGIRRREDIAINIEHLRHLVKAAAWLSGFPSG